MEIKENLSYTNDHEWIKIDGNTALVGITDFAQSELGDIVFIEVETIGENLNKNEVFGTFRRGGFSSKINFIDHFFEEIKIRIDNGQNKLLVLLIFVYKFFTHFRKF